MCGSPPVSPLAVHLLVHPSENRGAFAARISGAPPAGSGTSGFAAALAALLVLCLGCADSARSRPGTPPRHLLLITVDTLRADHLSAWLYPRETSSFPIDPATRGGPLDDSIDGLARAGVQFARAYAPRGQTFPSIATLMTGLSPLEHGARDNRDLLSGEVPTLAQSLANAGFATGGFTTNQLLSPGSGIERGFDHFRCDWTAPDRDLAALQAASQWFNARHAEGATRIFTWIHLMGPHLPYDPAPFQGIDFEALFKDSEYAGEANGSREFLDSAYASGRVLSPADVERVIAAYDGEVARINRLVSLFILGYANRGAGSDRLEDTLLVFAADHGEELHQRHGYWGHSKSVHSSVLHVPLFFRHPRSLTGRRVVGEVVELADVLPTVHEWFEVPLMGPVAGRSLLPLVDSHVRRPFASRPAFGHWRDRIFTASTSKWRLIVNPEGVVPDEHPPGPYAVPVLALYDLEKDPLELNDVAAQHPDVVESLRGAIDGWLAGLVQRTGGGALSPERRQALQELGYLGGDSDAASEPVFPAPTHPPAPVSPAPPAPRGDG